MGEVIRFVSKADRERMRLIQQARARYESIFPSADAINEQHDASMARAAGDAIVRRESPVSN